MILPMWEEQNHKLKFIKMSGAGNDFVIFDARSSSVSLSKEQITKISNRKNIGCDQLIIIKKSDKFDCLMEIYNSDGSSSEACGNATRCVASILLKEKEIQSSEKIKIETLAGILDCWLEGDLIAVDMGKPKFADKKEALFGFDFFLANVGNPHAVTFIVQPISDELFFKIVSC